MWKLLGWSAFLVVVFSLRFVPELWEKARGRWPGAFETDNPVPDEMPTSYMIGALFGFAAVIYAGLEYNAGVAIIALYLLFFIAVVLMHVPPYIRHQYRRIRGRIPPPAVC